METVTLTNHQNVDVNITGVNDLAGQPIANATLTGGSYESSAPDKLAATVLPAGTGCNVKALGPLPATPEETVQIKSTVTVQIPGQPDQKASDVFTFKITQSAPGGLVSAAGTPQENADMTAPPVATPVKA